MGLGNARDRDLKTLGQLDSFYDGHSNVSNIGLSSHIVHGT